MVGHPPHYLRVQLVVFVDVYAGKADSLRIAVEVAAGVVEECGDGGEGEEGVDEARGVEAEGFVKGC